jgi:hypothetical protein
MLLRPIDLFSCTLVTTIFHRRRGTTEDPLDFLQLLLAYCYPCFCVRSCSAVAVKKVPDPHLLEETPKLTTIPPHLARLSTVLITTR